MALRAVRATEASDALRDISPGIPPPGVPYHQWARSRPEGRRESKTLGFMRGHQAGIYDAYLTLRESYPEATEELRIAFRMEEDGSIVL